MKLIYTRSRWIIKDNTDIVGCLLKPTYCLPMRLVLLLLCVIACNGCTAPEKNPVRPNIILIMADDLGYETLRVNGSTSYDTPRLDELAETGMRFTNAFSTPLCTPSRVQIMTGKYNFRNYVGFGLLDPAERTFGHLLQEAGYRTAVVGKWQLYGNQRQRELAGRGGALPEEAGFDTYRLWQVKDRGYRFKHATLDTYGEGLITYENQFGPDLFADFIESFVSEPSEDPFFVYFPMALTHDPFRPTPDDPVYDTLAVDGVNDPAYFASNVAYMDKLIGRIVDHLEEAGLRENTLILFTGDNGTDRDVTSRFGEQVIQGNKGYPNRYGTHVPFVANWPGVIEPGQVNDNLVDFTDVLPTLMDVAASPIPGDFLTDGLSFYPQLIGEADTVRAWIFCHYAPEWGVFENSRFAQTRDWKLYEDGTFYHIAEDPEEANPGGEAMPPEVRDMLQDVLDRMQ